MIVVDTSALMAVLLDEPTAAKCMDAMREEDLVISAGTVAEALIVAEHRGVLKEMTRMIEGLGFEVASVTAADSRHVADAYRLWGKGVHPASLNFGDCFAYALAKVRDCALLYVGDDFSKTDIARAV